MFPPFPSCMFLILFFFNYFCLVFTSLHLHIVIDSEMGDISDKPFRFVRPAYQLSISPLLPTSHPSTRPSSNGVLSPTGAGINL